MNIKNALTPRWIFRINYDFLTRLKRFKIEHKWGCCPKKLYNSDPKRTARLQIDSFNFEFKPVFMQRGYLLHLNRDIYKQRYVFCKLYCINGKLYSPCITLSSCAHVIDFCEIHIFLGSDCLNWVFLYNVYTLYLLKILCGCGYLTRPWG